MYFINFFLFLVPYQKIQSFKNWCSIFYLLNQHIHIEKLIDFIRAECNHQKQSLLKELVFNIIRFERSKIKFHKFHP